MGKRKNKPSHSQKKKASTGVLVPAAHADAFALPLAPEGMHPLAHAIRLKHLGLFLTHFSGIPLPLDKDLLDTLLKALYSEYIAIADLHTLAAFFSLEYTFILSALKKIISFSAALTETQAGCLLYMLIFTLHDLTLLIPTPSEKFFTEQLYGQLCELVKSALIHMCATESHGPQFFLNCGTSEKFSVDKPSNFYIAVEESLSTNIIAAQAICKPSPDEFRLIFDIRPDEKTDSIVLILQNPTLAALSNMMLCLRCIYQIKYTAWLAQTSEYSETVRHILQPLMDKLVTSNPTLEESSKERVFELFLAVRGHDFTRFKTLYVDAHLQSVDLIAGYCSVGQTGFTMTLIRFSQQLIFETHRHFMEVYKGIESTPAQATHPYKNALTHAYDACQIAAILLCNTTRHPFLLRIEPTLLARLESDLEYLAVNNQDCSTGESPHTEACYTRQLLPRYQAALKFMLKKIEELLITTKKNLHDSAHFILNNLSKIYAHLNFHYEVTDTETTAFISQATPAEVALMQQPPLDIRFILREDKIENELSITAPLEISLDTTLRVIEKLTLTRKRAQKSLDLAKEAFALPENIVKLNAVKKLSDLQQKKLAHLFFNLCHFNYAQVTLLYEELRALLNPRIHYVLLNEAFSSLNIKHKSVITFLDDHTHSYKKSLYLAQQALLIFLFLQENLFSLPLMIGTPWLEQRPWDDHPVIAAHAHSCVHTDCEVDALLVSYQENLLQLAKTITQKIAMSQCAAQVFIKLIDNGNRQWIITLHNGTKAEYLALKSLEEGTLFRVVYKRKARSLKLIEPITACHTQTLNALLITAQLRHDLFSRAVTEFNTRSVVILAQLPILCMAFAVTAFEYTDLSTLFTLNEDRLPDLKEITLNYDMKSHNMTIEAPAQILSNFFAHSHPHSEVSTESTLMTPQRYFSSPAIH